MGPPVFVVAESVMRNIQEQVLAIHIRELYLFGCATLTTLLPLYTKTKFTIFINTLKDRTQTYSLTTKIENGKIPFLDCLVTRN